MSSLNNRVDSLYLATSILSTLVNYRCISHRFSFPMFFELFFFFSTILTTAGRKRGYQIVQEGLKDQPLSVSPDDTKKPEDLKLAMEDMNAKMENMQEDTNIVKQQHNISAEHVMGSADPKKMPDGRGIQGADLLQNNKKRIFIRSRL